MVRAKRDAASVRLRRRLPRSRTQLCLQGPVESDTRRDSLPRRQRLCAKAPVFPPIS